MKIDTNFSAATDLDPVLFLDDSEWPSLPAEWHSNSARPRPPRGTFFDENVDFADAAGDSLTFAVLKLLPEPRGKGRRVKPEHLYARVRSILANGLRCMNRKPSLVAHFRGDYYRGGPDWLSGPGLARTIDAMVKADLLTLNVGRRHRASTYAITQKVIDLASSCGVSSKSVVVLVPRKMLVRLYSAKPKRKPWEPKPKGTLLSFQPDAEARAWVAQLQAINTFIKVHRVDLPASPEEELKWVDHLNSQSAHGGEPCLKPELIHTALYRVFNNGSFDEGGRLFGGWWQNVPKYLRRSITIDGQPTMELDYSGCHINMLYNERGLECEGDPYNLPAISEQEAQLGLKGGTYRNCVKQYTQSLINCSKNGRPSRIKLKNGTPFPQAFKATDIVRMIEERHEPIKSAFRANAGLRLQRIDSDIALEVVGTAMNDGWLALPVHDSFLATTTQEQRLRELMINAYSARFGMNIEVTMVQ